MADNKMNKNQAVKEQKAYFLQLVEDKQLELIWHPDRREKCEIAFTHGYRAMKVYVYAVPGNFQYSEVEAGTDERLNEFIEDFKRKYKKGND